MQTERIGDSIRIDLGGVVTAYLANKKSRFTEEAALRVAENLKRSAAAIEAVVYTTGPGIARCNANLELVCPIRKAE